MNIKKLAKCENKKIIPSNHTISSNEKKIVLSLLVLLGIATVALSTSFGFFKKQDTIKNINMIAGILNYQITSSELDSKNQITINKNSEQEINLTIKSINTISSKYEVYYKLISPSTLPKDVSVGYLESTIDLVTGTIDSNQTKTITLRVINDSTSNIVLEFGIEGGLSYNELVLSKGAKLVDSMMDSDMTLAWVYTGSGTSPTSFPTVNDNYYVTNTTCEGGTATWNNTTWSLDVKSITGKRLSCKLTMGTKYKETILNGTEPVLTKNLIPITIADNGTIKYADITTEWYSYTNKRWANAIVLSDDTISYGVGEIIPESNIESYFVWIPKYSYKLWNLGNYNSLTSVTNAAQTIDIKFGTGNTSDSKSGECTTPMTSGATGSCQIGEYMTHPAFISMDTNGLWVGKFETGYKGATSEGTAQVNFYDSSKVIIKPNTYSWRNVQMGNAFLVSYNYLKNENSHMMKNSEWGSIAYLQHSKYGSQVSVRINNNSSYLTGYAATSKPIIGTTGVQCTLTTTTNCNLYGTDASITKPYNTDIGYLASTTGNITGVYDMSGGANEYMMAVIADASGNPLSGKNKPYNSGFKGNYGCPTCDSNTETANTTGIDFPDSKYYDLYKYGTNNQLFKNRILGDATGETGPFGTIKYGTQTRTISSWYKDNSYFVDSSGPWFYRGGNMSIGSDAGIFYFSNNYGSIYNFVSFRIVLAP